MRRVSELFEHLKGHLVPSIGNNFSFSLIWQAAELGIVDTKYQYIIDHSSLIGHFVNHVVCNNFLVHE